LEFPLWPSERRAARAGGDQESAEFVAVQRNRIHVDGFVPDDQALARIGSALAAGGRIVYDDRAPSWWTLADPEGNELDIAVSVGREEGSVAQ
jgi:glyoxalase superfamily protein